MVRASQDGAGRTTGGTASARTSTSPRAAPRRFGSSGAKTASPSIRSSCRRRRSSGRRRAHAKADATIYPEDTGDEAPPGAADGEQVLYASRAVIVGDGFVVAADQTAADGRALQSLDRGARQNQHRPRRPRNLRRTALRCRGRTAVPAVDAGTGARQLLGQRLEFTSSSRTRSMVRAIPCSASAPRAARWSIWRTAAAAASAAGDGRTTAGASACSALSLLRGHGPPDASHPESGRRARHRPGGALAGDVSRSIAGSPERRSTILAESGGP